MPTSDDERREVADDLQHQAKRLGPNMDAHEFANYVPDVIDPEYELRWDQMMLHLADLIDRPTCHLIEDQDGRTACSECGCTALYMSDATYCPDCGGMIVDDYR